MDAAARRVRTATLALLMISWGCGESLTGPAETAPRDVDGFVDQVRALGAEVAQSGPINQPFFSASGVRLLVNGHQVSVYAFPTSEGAAAAAGGVSADGSSIVGDGVAYNVLWVGPPHFFLRERVIVLYVGDDVEILELLEGILGPQFAGEVTS